MRDNGGVLTRPAAGSIPDTPGSYQFKDKDGRVIYVGKAKSLRSRLSNYFAAPETLLPRTRQMVAAAGVGRVDRGAQRGRGALPRDTTSSSSTSRASTSG